MQPFSVSLSCRSAFRRISSGTAPRAARTSSGVPRMIMRSLGRPPFPAPPIRLAGVSQATRRPSEIISMRSQTSATSLRMWELRMTVWFLPSSLISSRSSTICFGSRPEAGSSSISVSGFPIIAWANPHRCRYPLDRFRIRRFRTPLRSNASITFRISSPRSFFGTFFSSLTNERYSRTVRSV